MSNIPIVHQRGCTCTVCVDGSHRLENFPAVAPIGAVDVDQLARLIAPYSGDDATTIALRQQMQAEREREQAEHLQRLLDFFGKAAS